VHVVAPTGLAARNVSGVTTWTYAGLTPELNNFPLGKIEERAKGKKTRRRLENTDVLIIDEISMVDSIHLHRLDAIMRSGRSVFAPSNRFRPFGGVQVVFVGDFCQLPPVKPFGNCLYCGSFLRPNTEETVFTCRKVATHRWAEEDKWAFKSTAWRDAQLTHVYLDTIHRQKEAAFVDILNKLRVGAFLNRDEVSMLQNNRPKITDSAVRLYSTREEVRRENSHKFLALPTEPHEFYCLDSFHWMRGRDSATEFLHGKTKKSEDGNLIALRDHRFERHTRIKKGMLVALITNLDVHAGLCNGAQGKVIGWKPYDPACLPTYQGDPQSKEPPSSPTGRAVETGEHAEIREQEVRKFCQQRVDKMREDVWPEVYFFPYNGRPGFTRVIYPACTTTTWREEDLSEVLLCRTQIPLVPAWAMTIHKSQGMTLSRVIVDLAREFEEGQAYVALSRATGLDGLIVERAELLLEPKNRANKEVRQFYLEKFGERVFGDSFKDSGIYAGT
jgi:ATP-dependent DNA helicase PIF1